MPSYKVFLSHQLQKLQRDVEGAAKELDCAGLLKPYTNPLIIRGDEIIPASIQKYDHHCDSIESFYSTNKGNAIFELTDGSIITFYTYFDKQSQQMIRFSYGFCSCTSFDEMLLYDLIKAGGLPERQSPDPDSYGGNKSPTFLLRQYYAKEFPNNLDLQKTLLTLAENPIYIRCDFDSKGESPRHPKYHLTLNLIEQSRFKISDDFSFCDFIVFVLDVVFGIKNTKANGKQQLKINF